MTSKKRTGKPLNATARKIDATKKLTITDASAGVTDKGNRVGTGKRAVKSNAPASSPAPTKAQAMMIADGLPAAAIIDPATRKAAWANVVIKPIPRFDAPQREEGEDTKRFRAQLEAQERESKSRSAANSPFLAAKREARANKAPRPSREGMTSVADIAKQLKIIPRIARAALRAAKEPKPAQGWAFPASEVARITAIISKGLVKCSTVSNSPSKASTARSLNSSSATAKPSPKRVAKSKKPSPKSKRSNAKKGKRK